jgi:hypothetical protein
MIRINRSLLGTYVSPEAYAQPKEKGVKWAHNSEVRRQMKQSASKQLDASKQKAQGRNR